MKARWILVSLAALGLAQAARAETVSMVASLAGANEVPAVPSQGTASATVTLDTVTRALQWNMDVKGLSGPITAAHFHCPATPEQNAPVSIPIAGAGATSPLKGTATISPEQMNNLLSGRCYLNVHTAQHPQGEIRGQVIRR